MFPTNRGTCFRSKANPNGMKTLDSGTALAQESRSLLDQAALPFRGLALGFWAQFWHGRARFCRSEFALDHYCEPLHILPIKLVSAYREGPYRGGNFVLLKFFQMQ